MNYKCPNCGSNNTKLETDIVKCKTCGYKINVDELERQINEDESFVKDFIARNDELFQVHIVSEEDSIDELKCQLDDLKKSLLVDMNEQARVSKENIILQLEDLINSRIPKEKIIEKDTSSISANELIERANVDSDYTLVASRIRNEVETNLISKYKIPHKFKTFAMKKEELEDFIKNYKVGDNYPFSNTYTRAIKFHEDYVEIPPNIRFVMAGLSYNDAKIAADYWSSTNYFIHSLEANKSSIDKIKATTTLKEHFKKVLKFYREKQLYTID